MTIKGVTSSLSKTAKFYIIMIVLFPFIMYNFIYIIQNNTKNYAHWGITAFIWFCIIISLFIFIWGILVEVNIRMSKINFYDDKIEIKQLLGWGTKTVLPYDAFQGFITKGFKSRGQYHEYCYLIRDQKPVTVLSSQYFENYTEMRQFISERLKNLSV